MLPQERAAWSDLGGHMTLTKAQVKLPGKYWKWNSDWQVSLEKCQKDRPKVLQDHDGTYD